MEALGLHTLTYIKIFVTIILQQVRKYIYNSIYLALRAKYISYYLIFIKKYYIIYIVNKLRSILWIN